MSKVIELDKFGDFTPFVWTHDYLVRVLTGGEKPMVKQLNLKNALRKIKREDFVPIEHKSEAYMDKDIELGYGVKLDKPTVIAQMLALLSPKFDDHVLDIGTGSGWTAAILAAAVGEKGKVTSVERLQFLVEIARTNLGKYPDLENVEVFFKDASLGIPEHAPYDGIHVAAAYQEIPAVLTGQLKIGGRLVAPTSNKDLRLIERISEKEFKETIHKGYFFDTIKTGVE